MDHAGPRQAVTPHMNTSRYPLAVLDKVRRDRRTDPRARRVIYGQGAAAELAAMATIGAADGKIKDNRHRHDNHSRLGAMCRHRRPEPNPSVNGVVKVEPTWIVDQHGLLVRAGQAPHPRIQSCQNGRRVSKLFGSPVASNDRYDRTRARG